MKWAFGIALFWAALLLNATPPAKTKHPKPVPGKSPRSSAKTASSRNPTHNHGRSRYARRAPAPSYQVHPDPQRYQEIQQALADRGYFKGQVNGQWNDDSVDALKRFQADQKLENDGKINSLTLIGLGLGPKHEGSAVKPQSSADTVAVPSVPVTLPEVSSPPQ